MQLVRCCLEGIEDLSELKSIVQSLRPLRIKFLKELRGQLSEIDDYLNCTIKGFYIADNESYLLGKYFDIENKGIKMPIALISELYVLPEYRHIGIAKQMIWRVNLYCVPNGIPVVLGCADELVPFYEKLGFVSVNCAELLAGSKMMFSGNNSQLKKFCEILA